MNFDSTLSTARRATVGKTVLGWVALACLILNGAFWGMLMLDLLAPRSIGSPQSLQAGLAIVAFVVILPLFWSMLLPSSPAGRLLQRQQWATPGHVATSAAAAFLTWMAGTWLRLWWQAQPSAVEVGQDLFLTITSLIAGVLVPALAWCVTTPEQFVAALEQARHVKRIEHAMKMEEAAMRAAYARAVSLLHADLTNLTIEQKRELAGILGGFARMQQQSMHQIAASWKDMYGVECQLATIPDQQLLTSYQQVAGLLADGGEALGTSANYAMAVSPSLVLSSAEWDDGMGRRDDTPSVPARAHGTPHEEAYHKARGVLDGAWKRTEQHNREVGHASLRMVAPVPILAAPTPCSTTSTATLSGQLDRSRPATADDCCHRARNRCALRRSAQKDYAQIVADAMGARAKQVPPPRDPPHSRPRRSNRRNNGLAVESPAPAVGSDQQRMAGDCRPAAPWRLVFLRSAE